MIIIANKVEIAPDLPILRNPNVVVSLQPPLDTPLLVGWINSLMQNSEHH